MEYENHNQQSGSNDLYSKRLRAGTRRTYFFDVRATRSNDFYLTITESKKKFNQDGYERHKIFLYKEDFNKFLAALQDAVNHVKTELLPEYNFDEFNRNDDNDREEASTSRRIDEAAPSVTTGAHAVAAETTIADEEQPATSTKESEPSHTVGDAPDDDLKW